jgi:predicted N-acetyltransferase YhbS
MSLGGQLFSGAAVAVSTGSPTGRRPGASNPASNRSATNEGTVTDSAAIARGCAPSRSSCHRVARDELHPGFIIGPYRRVCNHGYSTIGGIDEAESEDRCHRRRRILRPSPRARATLETNSVSSNHPLRLGPHPNIVRRWVTGTGEGVEGIRIRLARAADAPECGRICYDAFAAIANFHRFPPEFPSIEAATAALSRMIIHPGFFGVVAEHDEKLLGSNFLDERSTIFGVGPLTVDPDAQNRRVGEALMKAVLERGAQRPAPGVRLMQTAYHNRSMSLYAKLGFDVREPFAAMRGKPLRMQLPGYTIRPATDGDEQTCNALCLRVHGHDRGGELRDAIAQGKARVVERQGRITGYTTGIAFYAHSIAETNDDLAALVGAAEEFGGPGFLVPMRNTEFLRWCLAHELRIVYAMNLMTIGLYQEPRGPFLASVLY